MNILFCITDNLYQPALAMINSIISNNENIILNFYMIHSTVSEEHIEIIRSFIASKDAKFICAKIDKNDIYSNYESLGVRLPIEAFYRLLAISIFPNIDKMIYVDVDVICDGSLIDLWNMSFGQNYILGVPRYVVDETCQFSILGIDANAPFVNSGVLVMNLKALRNIFDKSLVKEYLDLYLKYHFTYADQLFINAWLKGRIGLIDDKWNRKCAEVKGAYERFVGEEKAILYHWAGSSIKPYDEYEDNTFFYNLNIYEKYMDLEVLSEEFKNKVKKNIRLNENKKWIILENRYRFRQGYIYDTNLSHLYINGGKKIDEYLKKENLNNVAIYGFTEIAKIWCQEVYNDSGVIITAIIDRKLIENKYMNFEIVLPSIFKERFLENTDAIIITISNEFMNIKRYLEEMGIYVPCIAAEAIVLENDIFGNK